MVDVLLFTVSIISAIIAYLAAAVFIMAYAKEQKTNRLIYGLAFLLYGMGHTIMAVISIVTLGPRISPMDVDLCKSRWLWYYWFDSLFDISIYNRKENGQGNSYRYLGFPLYNRECATCVCSTS